MTGFEPATLGTTIRCSNRLSYNRHLLSLHTHYTKYFPRAYQVNDMRNWYVSFAFPRIVCIVVSSYAPGGTRTPNPLSRNQLRYPITPQEQVHQARVELATFRVSDECSNQLSYWCIWEWKDSNLLGLLATDLQSVAVLQLCGTPL
jgi:hypothetical protein